MNECPKGGYHDWKEVYYGTECSKCKKFYPDGCEPWSPDPEDIPLVNFYEYDLLDGDDN